MYKFGRNPAVHTLRTFRNGLALARALDPLGTPPAASNDYVAAVNAATGGAGGAWGMMGNDSVGDCTIADCGHQIMLHTANASTIVIPTQQDILSAYSAATGYDPSNPASDQGANETSVCQFMETTGILGHKSNGDAMVDPANLDHIRWCIQLFGACRLGIEVPDYLMTQFNLGKPWAYDVTQSQTSEGGHDVPLVKYDGQYFYCVTWGKLQPIDPSFFSKHAGLVDEAHAEVYADWIKSTGVAPSGFDLSQLLADMSHLKQ